MPPTPTDLHNAKCLLRRGSAPEWVAAKTGVSLSQVREIQKQIADEREAQRRSFAYGNAHLDNPAITREMIEEASDSLLSKAQASLMRNAERVVQSA